MSTRPKFLPNPCSDENALEINANKFFTPVLSCPVDLPLELFETAMMQLIQHPEYNSTLILRSEMLFDCASEQLVTDNWLPSITGYAPTRNIRRRLLPRRPGRDDSLDQNCTFYAQNRNDLGSSDADFLSSVVILTPILEDVTQMPYFHPPVSHLAFCALTSHLGTAFELRIEAIPYASTNDARNPSSRLYRTCLALLDTLHRYMWGFRNDYQKRVHHDCIIPRETYQDLYLVMRERWKTLVNDWKESTDPRKHVFELIKHEKDIAIATYLILLWKIMYSPHHNVPLSTDFSNEPWKKWPRPPGGFIDFGCGNGLLTHILVSEGYKGIGVDVRSRISWDSYPSSTQSSLYVYGLDPTLDEQWLSQSHSLTRPRGSQLLKNKSKGTASPFFPRSPKKVARRASPLSQSILATGMQDKFEDRISNKPVSNSSLESSQITLQNQTFSDIPKVPLFRPNAFQIYNHADELTPWAPIFATIHKASGYISIPCCSWSFESRFVRGTEMEWGIPPIPSNAEPTIEAFITSLNLGGAGPDNAKSAYSQYRIWLAGLSYHCGWEIESDVLRIPSTRGWALVGRNRAPLMDNEGLENSQAIVSAVKDRGLFKIRTSEGKDH